MTSRADGLPPPPAPRWEVSAAPEPAVVQGLQAGLSLPRVLCALLAVRGLRDPDDAKRFLRPELAALHPPLELPDMEVARDRILRAVDAGETVLVHGDYDVDGVAAVALLTRWIRRLGGRAVPFVPHRLRDGYDLGPAGLAAARETGASLLVTVDCGILAHGAVEEARRAGVDVVVTDHHAPGATLPPALAVVNPNREDSRYPGPGLCGAGVAFKLCQALAAGAGVPAERLYEDLDLVALATVADLVPLEGENRVLVRYGLRALERSEKPGVRALLRSSGLEGRTLAAGTVGFVLAPRLNAAGRVGEASEALRLLLTDDEEEARRLAEAFEVQNRERQAEDRRTLEEVLERLHREFDPGRDFGIVVAGDGWHPGVIGIVASRVVERIHRPTVLVALDGEWGRGSARSVPGFHLLEAVRRCGEHLERFGGHRQAAGMELRREAVEPFRACFDAVARERLGGTDLRPVLAVDLEVELEEMKEEVHRYLRYLGPHGIGNPRPVFLARSVGVSGAREVGTGHLKLRLLQGGRSLEAIGFGLAERIAPSSLGGGPVDVAFQLQENEYRGRRTLQARILDLRPAGVEP